MRKPLLTWSIVALVGVLLFLTLADVQRQQMHGSLVGVWVGKVHWHGVTQHDYVQTMETRCTFKADGTFGSVFRLRTGAVGGLGRYRLHGNLMTLDYQGMSIDGHTVHPSDIEGKPTNFGAPVRYRVSGDGQEITLVAADDALETPAPCYPLLVTNEPVVLTKTNLPP